MRENPYHRHLIAILAAGFGVRVVLALITPENLLSWEAGENYLMRARAVLDGRIPYLDFWESKPPLWTYTFALWGRIFGVSVFSLKVLIAAAETGFIALFFVFARELLRSARLALFAAATYAFLPQVLFVGAVEGKYESLTFLFLIAGLWLVLTRRPYAAGLVLGIGMGYKYNVALGILPGMVFMLRSREAARRVAGFAVAAVAFFGLIVSPFLVLDPGGFLDDTVINFATGEGHHHIANKAISLWGALLLALGVDVPALIPHVLLAALTLLISARLVTRRHPVGDFSLVTYGFTLTAAFLIFARVGNIQYFNWMLPFLILIFWKIWSLRGVVRSAKRFLWVAGIHSALALYTWKNWNSLPAGPFLVVAVLALTVWLLVFVLRRDGDLAGVGAEVGRRGSFSLAADRSH